jgi:hypothetical protein
MVVFTGVVWLDYCLGDLLGGGLGVHFWVNASWSLKTLSKSSAMSKTSFRSQWEKSNVHFVLPKTNRRTSFCC